MADRLSRRLPPPETGPTASRRGGAWPLAALATILVVTAGWWGLALWPAADAAPEWLARTRAVCFGAAAGALPDVTGWAILIGQPILLTGVLLVGWGRETVAALRRVWRVPAGRAALLLALAASLAGLGTAGARVAAASARTAAAGFTNRRAEPAPPLLLTTQSGRTLDLADLRGRPVYIVFAYAHCETVCPSIVREVVAARREVGARGVPAGLVVVTLDPWRDTPVRLPSIASRWMLDATRDEWVVSGSVERVEAVLDAWDVPGRRDPRTGELAHPRLVFVVDAAGDIAFVSGGGTEELVRLGASVTGPRASTG